MFFPTLIVHQFNEIQTVTVGEMMLLHWFHVCKLCWFRKSFIQPHSHSTIIWLFWVACLCGFYGLLVDVAFLGGLSMWLVYVAFLVPSVTGYHNLKKNECLMLQRAYCCFHYSTIDKLKLKLKLLCLQSHNTRGNGLTVT